MFSFSRPIMLTSGFTAIKDRVWERERDAEEEAERERESMAQKAK